MTMRQSFAVTAVVITAGLLSLSLISTSWLWAFVLIGPIMLLGMYICFKQNILFAGFIPY